MKANRIPSRNTGAIIRRIVLQLLRIKHMLQNKLIQNHIEESTELPKLVTLKLHVRNAAVLLCQQLHLGLAEYQ